MKARFEVYAVNDRGHSISDTLHVAPTPTEALKWVADNRGTNTGVIKHNPESPLQFEHWIVPVGISLFAVVKH